jgi:hypothetical protein
LMVNPIRRNPMFALRASENTEKTPFALQGIVPQTAMRALRGRERIQIGNKETGKT